MWVFLLLGVILLFLLFFFLFFLLLLLLLLVFSDTEGLFLPRLNFVKVLLSDVDATNHVPHFVRRNILLALGCQPSCLKASREEKCETMIVIETNISSQQKHISNKGAKRHRYKQRRTKRPTNSITHSFGCFNASFIKSADETFVRRTRRSQNGPIGKSSTRGVCITNRGPSKNGVTQSSKRDSRD